MSMRPEEMARAKYDCAVEMMRTLKAWHNEERDEALRRELYVTVAAMERIAHKLGAAAGMWSP